MVGLLSLRGKRVPARGTPAQLGSNEVHIHTHSRRTALYLALQHFSMCVAPIREAEYVSKSVHYRFFLRLKTWDLRLSYVITSLVFSLHSSFHRLFAPSDTSTCEASGSHTEKISAAVSPSALVIKCT